jgi:hypothetical protein
MQMKKSQAALEFLMTYGWAILVVLAAIAALASFGVLNPNKYLPEKCIIQTGISCESAKLQTSQAQLFIKNGLGKTIDITLLEFKDLSDSVVCSQDYSASPVSMPADTTTTLTASTSCSFGSSGDTFKGKIEIQYTESTSGFNKTLTGEINQRIE